MTIHVRLFAAIREVLGRESLDLTLVDGATPEDVWKALLQHDRSGALVARRTNLAAAINRKYSRFDAPLADGDELVFIPPVSGG
ncbi:MAG: MoaD/ThiS family protein [Vicinamibacteria bacterium]